MIAVVASTRIRMPCRQVLILASCVHFSRSFLQTLSRHNPSFASGAFTYSSAVKTFAPRSLSALTVDDDEHFMKLAIDCAKKGVGHTFPNPAVGCVLVRDKDKQIIGQGFHPQAGYPHAEVFALLQAANHTADGVALAQAVVDNQKRKNFKSGSIANVESNQLMEVANHLTQQYAEENGPSDLFKDCLQIGGENDGNKNPFSAVTAYVTLEPCCHYGKTPPCAASLALAKPARVVIGFRDPNPRVDGGGVRLLKEAGIEVIMAQGALQKACSHLVTNFVKRITPRPEINTDNYDHVNGAMRSALRSYAARKKQDGSMIKITWGGATIEVDGNDLQQQEDHEMAIDSLELPAKWMEHVDSALWSQELVLLQLNKAIKRKKLVQRLGDRIAAALQAHVAQTVGHTVLLYRPSIPAKLDLAALATAASTVVVDHKIDDEEEPAAI